MAFKSRRVAFQSAWGPDPHTQINHRRLDKVAHMRGGAYDFRSPMIDVWIGWLPKTCCARNCTTDPGPGQRKIRASGLMDFKRSTTTAMVLAILYFCRDVELEIFKTSSGELTGMG
jgi:hypothetical protein